MTQHNQADPQPAASSAMSASGRVHGRKTPSDRRLPSASCRPASRRWAACRTVFQPGCARRTCPLQSLLLVPRRPLRPPAVSRGSREGAPCTGHGGSGPGPAKGVGKETPPTSPGASPATGGTRPRSDGAPRPQRAAGPLWHSTPLSAGPRAPRQARLIPEVRPRLQCVSVHPSSQQITSLESGKLFLN